MLNLVSFETPPLGRQERSANTTAVTAAVAIRGKEESSSNTACFHGHLDLSLGISLSHGGSDGGGGCDASSCGGYKQESYGGRQGSRDNKDTTAATTAANVITAGHDHVGDLTTSGGGGGGWAAAFMPSPTGFMHPWSLAARQQKAAAEQDWTAPTTYMASDDRVATSPSTVGWPPVHTSRRNIVTAMQVTKPTGATAADRPESTTTTTAAHAAAGGEKKVAAPLPMTDSTVVATTRPAAANMFAKVHMEGYAIGRKVNLRAQGGYDSLSRVLTNMTTNFFCRNPADCSGAGTGERDVPNTDKFIFLYEDFEGDRMLVGDVPWELFLASAKRLYIVRNPASSDKGQGACDRKYKTEEPTKD